VAETNVPAIDQAPQPQSQRSTARMIARNTVFGIGAEFMLKVIGFLFNLFVINTLGGERFGQYTIVLAWAGLFSVLGDLGINQYLAREIAADRRKTDELFWDTVLLRFILAIVSSAITIVGAIAYGYSDQIVLGVAMFTVSYFFMSVLAPLNSVLQGNERLDYTSIFTVVMQVIFMLMATIYLLLDFSWLWLLTPMYINLPAVIILQIWAIRRHNYGPARFRFNPNMWWVLVRGGLPFAAIQLALSFSFQVDTIFLSANVPDEVVGYYAAAYRLILTLVVVSYAFNTAIVPSLARDYAQNPVSVRPWYYTTVRVMLWVGLPMAVGGSLLADKIIGFLYPGLFPAWIAFAILVWDMPLVLYTSFCGNMTTAIKQERSAMRIYVSVGLLNVVLNAVFISVFGLGLVGACFATLLTDAFGLLLFYVLFRREFGSGLQFRRLARIIVAAALMGVVVLLLRDTLHFLLIIPVAAAFYLVVTWYSGAYSPDERAWIMGFVKRRLKRA
jgi:O-antigen/teichoic acid export membrane protein